tara:strand:+ start:748 stop:1167 length:420 start_codon:yes stop_codon:yes gene_type:complete
MRFYINGILEVSWNDRKKGLVSKWYKKHRSNYLAVVNCTVALRDSRSYTGRVVKDRHGNFARVKPIAFQIEKQSWGNEWVLRLDLMPGNAYDFSFEYHETFDSKRDAKNFANSMILNGFRETENGLEPIPFETVESAAQ